MSGRDSPIAHSPPAAAPDPPPPKCPEHADDPDPPPCGRCADARKARERWDAEQHQADLERRSRQARERAELARAEIDACQLCDATGYRGGKLCHHRAAANGAGAAREAIRGVRRPAARASPPDPVADAMARRAAAREAHHAEPEESAP